MAGNNRGRLWNVGVDHSFPPPHTTHHPPASTKLTVTTLSASGRVLHLSPLSARVQAPILHNEGKPTLSPLRPLLELTGSSPQFGKEYQKVLESPAFPPEWRQTAIEYRKVRFFSSSHAPFLPLLVVS